MKIGMFFRVAVENMVQNKLRTSLTLLGLIVGISSVLLMTGLGRGYQQTNDEMMSSLLPNKLTLRQSFSRSNSSPFADAVRCRIAAQCGRELGDREPWHPRLRSTASTSRGLTQAANVHGSPRRHRRL